MSQRKDRNASDPDQLWGRMMITAKPTCLHSFHPFLSFTLFFHVSHRQTMSTASCTCARALKIKSKALIRDRELDQSNEVVATAKKSPEETWRDRYSTDRERNAGRALNPPKARSREKQSQKKRKRQMQREIQKRIMALTRGSHALPVHFFGSRTRSENKAVRQGPNWLSLTRSSSHLSPAFSLSFG